MLDKNLYSWHGLLAFKNGNVEVVLVNFKKLTYFNSMIHWYKLEYEELKCGVGSPRLNRDEWEWKYIKRKTHKPTNSFLK